MSSSQLQTGPLTKNMRHIASDTEIKASFWRYAIPSIAAMLVSGLYQIIDGIFVGHYVGVEGLAGINMAWPITFVVSGLGIMIGMGGGSLISIKRGEDDKVSAQQALNTSFVLMLIFAIFSSAGLLLWGADLLRAQGGEGTTFTLGFDYVNVFGYGTIATIMAAAIPMLVRNDENPNVATALMILGALLNIVLDYVFIGLWQWQLEGAALATIIAQSVVAVLGIIYFFSKYSSLKLDSSLVKVNPRMAARIINLGASSLVMYLYTSFVFALHNRLFMQYGTSVTVGAFAIVGYIMTLYYLVAEGIAEGMQPPVSYYFGSQQYENIKKMLLLSVKVTVIAGVSFIVILNVMPNLIISLFTSDYLTNESAELTAAAKNGIHLHLFAMFLDGIIVLSSVYFMAIGKGAKALAISVGNMLIQLPFLYFLPQWLGVDGIWLALPLSNIVLFVIVAPLVWHDIKQREKAFVISPCMQS
ncbi:MATE family efflux transporter [Moritella sp. Urea-trap-13]|uniref:MATE family efflux transporter n=1 Tax=Moritella sp. Urea-trap-13 TaxID=2058327 RepID=UPI000C3205C7|nr:MATE family efflux transporter [Moritella sp. Urea-trap-13]PKH08099.1 multidrug efflux protein [Moritella sp. Urea-trap-13]